jgi:bifunctional ADP-heptose synthase (sugar kinase/adenylyltransferase)
MIGSCKWVDNVVVFHEPTPCELIRILRPDFFIKGSDYKGKQIPEIAVCNELAINYKVCPNQYHYSTSKLLGLIP